MSRIDDVAARWLRVPLDPPIADSTHVLRFIDWIVVEVRAGDHVGRSVMLTFDYAPALLKAMIDRELRPLLIGREADDIRAVHHDNLRATEYVGQAGLQM